MAAPRCARIVGRSGLFFSSLCFWNWILAEVFGAGYICLIVGLLQYIISKSSFPSFVS